MHGENAHKMAICLIVKDEGPDIAEWIIHHWMLGFTKFFVYDNESSDGTVDVVNSLKDYVDIEYIHWPNIETNLIQINAYDDCIARAKGLIEWLAFFDADEFLIAEENTSRLEAFLDSFDSGIDEICFNWLIFGSSGLEHTNSQLIMEAFTRRGPLDFGGNVHVKCIVRPEKVLKCYNPHYFVTEGPCVNVHGELAVWNEIGGPGISAKIVQGAWRLHHYFVRSRAHWKKRIIRGQRGTGVVRFVEKNELQQCNDIDDYSAKPYSAQVRKFMEEKGLEIGASVTINDISPLSCCIDRISYPDISGWVANGPGLPPSSLSAFIDDTLIGIIEPTISRMDVVSAGLASDDKCGFDFCIPAKYCDTKLHRFQIRDDSGDVVLMTRDDDKHSWISFKSRFSVSDFFPILGCIDIATIEGCHGWALFPDHPDRIVALKVQINDLFEVDLICDIHRADIEILHGAKRAGFRLQIPDEIDGCTEISLKFLNQNHEPISLKYNGIQCSQISIVPE